MSQARVKVVDNTRWELSGELNFESVPRLWRKMAILFKTPTSLTLDLSGVLHCNSAGLALLVEWLREAQRLDKKVSFENTPEQLLAVAKSCGVQDLLSRP